MRLTAALGLAFGFVVSASPRSEAATFSLILTNLGAVTGTGTFSFSDSLVGQTIDAAQVTSFNLNLDTVGGPPGDFIGLGDAAHPDPLAPGTPSPFPYFKFNSASDTFIPYTFTSSPAILIHGGYPNAAGTEFFGFYIDAPNQSYHDSPIYTEDVLAHGSNFGYGFFDQIVVTQIPEPASAGLVALGLGMVAMVTLARRRAGRPLG